MSVVGKVVSTGVDFLLMPVSLVVKAFTGRTIGDYVSGNQRPPSKTGFIGSVVSLVADMGLPIVGELLLPGIGGLAGTALVLGTKAITGNTIGDYITGNTDEQRREAELNHLEKDYVAVQQRIAARERGQAQAQVPVSVSAPSVGEQQYRQGQGASR